MGFEKGDGSCLKRNYLKPGGPGTSQKKVYPEKMGISVLGL